MSGKFCRFTADFLTFVRLVIAIILPFLVFLPRNLSLSLVIYLTIIGWTTDVFDGSLARRGKLKTFLGEYDFGIDMLMVAGGFLYLILAKWINAYFNLSYLILFILIALITRKQWLIMILAFPMDLALFFAGYKHSPIASIFFIIWIVIFLLVFWKRFWFVLTNFWNNFSSNFSFLKQEKK